MRYTFFFCCLAVTGLSFAQQGLVPYSPSSRVDKQGNEWNLEQNGMVNRPNSGAPSILSGCGTLMIGNQQFYTNQPMSTPDGKEVVMISAQPLMGFNVTRRIRFMEKEGGLRYIEQLTNTLGRDVTITLEIRHSFSGGARAFMTDRARLSNGSLEAGESGIIVQPGQGNSSAPALICTVTTPQSADKPRVSGRNQYQLSFFHTLTVPAGKSASILHTLGQVKTSLTPDEEELQRLFRPLAFSRMVKEIPRDVLPTIANLKEKDGGEGLSTWFPAEHWGIKPETYDVLAIGSGTQLKGRAQCGSLTLKHKLGTLTIPWAEVRALAGARFAGMGRGCVWLRSGERYLGDVEATDLRFTLVSGLNMDLKLAELDRLVMAKSDREGKWPDGIAALIEMEDGERLALADLAASLPMMAVWGPWDLRIADLVRMIAPTTDATSGLAMFRDGTSLRLMPSGALVSVSLQRFGMKTLTLDSIRQIGTAELGKPHTEADVAPTQSFVDLSGEQRLMGRITGDKLRLSTAGGLVELSPASIRELKDVTEEQEESQPDEGRVYQAEIWGGGTVMGQGADALVRIEGKGFAWMVPMRHIVRVGNPVPKIESSVVARISVLIRELGDEDWSKREAATRELRELGALARPSLQDALKQATDPEVTRRIEVITQDLDSQ